ncbi:MAG: hypothetical protein KY394_06985 [Actinobacteria bacterium]|nr:hypothetical protein [Actinomycetota bacterium]
MDQITLVTEGWAAGRVFAARSFLDRWRGVKRLPDGSRLLLAARWVHGFGLRDPLVVAAIDAEMKVAEVRILRRGRLLSFPQARFLLEMPTGATPPPVGSVLEMRRG